LISSSKTPSERRCARVWNQPLSSRESARIEQGLAKQEEDICALGVRRSTLAARRDGLKERVPVLCEQTRVRREQIVRQAEARAGFEGRIGELQREAAATECVWRIMYRSEVKSVQAR
jgi:hypothetical protein